MTGLPLATLALVFLATALLFASLWLFVAWWLERSRTRLARIRPEDSEPTLVLDAVPTNGGRVGWWAGLRRSAVDRMERTQLGLTAAEGGAVVLFCGVILAAVFFFWRYEAEESWMAVPAFFIGAAIPLGYFIFRQRAWRRRVQDQLPDSLFLMARSLRAGLSIDQSIGVIGDHGVAPLSREFSRMHRQLELGLALPQVLRSAADRLSLVDFSVFASVLSLHRTTGGNLPVLMDRLAHTTRDHNQLRGLYRSATSLGRYGSIFVFLLASGLIAYLCFFQRDLAANYFESTAGLVLFCIGAGLLLGAMVVLYFLVRRDEP
jgi:Flp pilus assembly protein TadB